MSWYEQISLLQVRRALMQPLIGAPAQLRMATTPRARAEDFEHDGPPRLASVLVLLYGLGRTLHMSLTRRSAALRHHQGQISLPGGGVEAGDLVPWATALRESREELGLGDTMVRHVGALSPLYIPSSHYLVHPFVGWCARRPKFAPKEAEVAEIIEMPLCWLWHPASKREETWQWQGCETRVPFYFWQGHKIWGATAMILSELEMLVVAARRESHAILEGP